jgi:hypothetical protein
MALEKAQLIKLGADDAEEEKILVQFNPASLKLTLSNDTAGGGTPASAKAQYTGKSSTDLSFDLVFDTADEDLGGGKPRSVRERTARIEQFVLPQGTGKTRKAPPRVMFVWGGLKIKGTVQQLAIDFDLFAQTGEPLRAKMGVSIKEQDAKYELGKSEEGNAPPAGKGKATPGSEGGGDEAANRTGTALAGESAADFAVRMGLDAGAWRGLSAGLDGTLSLSAGLEIDFDASLSLSAGVGVSVGFQADLGVSLEASLGLEASASISAGASFSASAEASAGFALSAAGGVQAAVETVAIASATAAAQASVQAFGAGGAATVSASLPTGGGSAVASGAAAGISAAAGTAITSGGTAASGSAASRGGSASSSSSSSSTSVTTSTAGATASTTPAAYAPPRADPRATGYGYGVPLRPRTGPAAQASAGVVALRPYARARDVPVSRDPTTPPWQQLPPLSAPRSAGVSTGVPPLKPKVGAHTGRAGCGCGCGPKGGGR